MQQLEAALEEKEVKLLQAAVIGRRLLEENEKLRRAASHAPVAAQGPQVGEAAKVEELHAKVRALQEQLRDAERVNTSLCEELALKEREALRFGLGRSDQLSRRSEGRDGKGGRGSEAAGPEETGNGDDAREADLLARRNELAEKKRLEQIRELEERNAALGDEMAARRSEWEARVKQEGERAALLQRQLSVMQEEWEHATAAARQREGEALEAKRELAHLQRMVKQISEEKEIAEERVLERNYSGGAAAGNGSSMEEEKQRMREMEDARRALIQIRNRTIEAETMRDQVVVVVKENERLRTELDEVRQKLEAEVRRRTEAEIEMEIWKERGVKLQAQVK